MVKNTQKDLSTVLKDTIVEGGSTATHSSVWDGQTDPTYKATNSYLVLLYLTTTTITTQLFTSEGGSAALNCTKEYLPERFRRFAVTSLKTFDEEHILK